MVEAARYLTFKVGGSTQTPALAGAIANEARGRVRDGRQGEPIILQAIGAGAVNVAVKATAQARMFLAPRHDLATFPSFVDIRSADLANERTGIELALEIRERH